MQSLRNCLSAFKNAGNPLVTLGLGLGRQIQAQSQFAFGNNMKPSIIGSVLNHHRSLSTLTPRISTTSATPSSSGAITSSSNSTSSSFLQPSSTSLFTSILRTGIRCHFPKPSEVKRLRKHGLKHRLKTKGGRDIIFRRILKGRHCLAHGW